jgi:DNA end-binding protein Ku
MAEQLVTTLADEFQPEKYSDTYKNNLMRIIEEKLKGKKIEVEEPEELEPTNVLDLMTRLQESLAQGKKKKTKKAAAPEKAEVEAEAPPTKEKPKKKRKTA